MERSEPTLVPEWLRSTGSVTGGGSSTHHFASSSDVPSLAHQLRNRTSKSTSDFDTPRSSYLDRSSSSNSRRSSSNGSAKHAYSSFNRSHRDKDREKEKERLNFGEPWDRCSESLDSLYTSKDQLRRSQSLVSRNHKSEIGRRAAVDLKSSSNSSHNNGNGLISGGGVGIQNTVFDKDFPSLGTEDRQGVQDVGRVSSPGFTSAVQGLPVGNTTLIGGEQFKSALAEVPNAIIGSSSSGSFSVQPTAAAATSVSGASIATAGLNMAEALAQAPARARTAPQLSNKTQRLEELALKQSRQLIPVTPSMPKSSALGSSDKLKPKTVVRAGEMNAPVKGGQQQPSQSHHANQSIHGGPVKSDAPKTSHGKFLVLKPVWENGISSPKDVTSPTSNASSRAANSPLAVAPPVVSAPSRSPNNPKLSAMERKVAALDLKSGATLEKRPLSQVQSRNDFFNLLKKKTSVNSSIALPDAGPNISSPTMEKTGDITREVFSDPASPHIENGGKVTGNGDSSEEVQKFSDTGRSAAIYPDDEEEARFLRSLGWEESSCDDGGLTEEEINAFYERYMKSKPSLKLSRGMWPKLSTLPESHATNLGRETAGLSSSDSGSEA